MIIILSATLLAISILIVTGLRRETNQSRHWTIEMAIFPNGSTGSSYFIRIAEDGTISSRFGSRNEFRVRTLDEDFFREVHEQMEDAINDNEMQNLLTLAQELEVAGGISETGISFGSWEVVLKYNDIIYEMDYWDSDFEPLKRLVDEIIRLSPIQVYLRGWS